MIRRSATWSSMLFATACVLAASWPAAAQTSPAIPVQATPQSSPTQDHAPMEPVAWSGLSPAQRRILAPVQGQWNQLRPARQHRLAGHASHWATLPPEHQRQIRERLTRWARMTPAQRHQLRENARAFHDLTPAERAKVSAAFKKFQSLPPAQRKALRERWRKMSPDQRRDWATEHSNQPIPAHPPGVANIEAATARQA